MGSGYTPWRQDAVLLINLHRRYMRQQKIALVPIINPNKTNAMNTDIHSKPPISPFPEAAKEMARQGIDAAKDAAQRAATATKEVSGKATDAAKDVKDAAKDMYQTMSSKVEEGMVLTKEYAQRAVDATKDAAHHASDAAKDMYQTAATKAEDTLEHSKEYVRNNPVPVVLGAFALGIAIGYLIVTGRREPTFRERYSDAVGSLSDQMGRVGNNLKFW